MATVTTFLQRQTWPDEKSRSRLQVIETQLRVWVLAVRAEQPWGVGRQRDPSRVFLALGIGVLAVW